MLKGKGFISVITALMLLLGTICVPVAANAVNEITINEEFEAELAVKTSDTKIVSLDNASGGQALSFSGARHDSDLDTIAPDATFVMNIETAGIYVAYAKFWTTSAGDDSIYYALDDENYLQVSPTNTADFAWVKLGFSFLNVGEHTLNFKRRESGCKLDKVMVTSSEGLYVDPPEIVESGIYPQTITPETVGTVEPFVAGDRVAFIGDSITYGGAFHSLLFNYYATRYPESNFTYINKGIGGDSAGEIFERINHDVYDATFNKAVVMVGMNDMSRTEYFAGNELVAGAAERRKRLMDTYKASTKDVYDSLVSHGIKQIIFVGPSMFDEWLPRENTNKDTSPGFNNILRKANSYLYDWSKTEGFEYIDVNTPQTIIAAYHKKDDPTFTFISDRIHPSVLGHYIMAYAFLKAQGETGEVATVTVNAAENTSNASRASISNLTATTTGVSYTYSPTTLPIAADEDYRKVEELLPITSEMNRETIKVSGLDDGMYNIKMNGEIVATCSAADLAEGVNVADKKNNPSQKVSLVVKLLTDVKRAKELKYREFVAGEINNINKYNLDTTSDETMLSSARAYVTANASDSTKEADVATLNAYITDKENEANVLAGIKEVEDSVYASNTPVTSDVVIEPTDVTMENTNNKVHYLPFGLPENTVRIIPYAKDYKVNASNVRFTDTTGEELTAMPAENLPINVTADISNDGASDETAVFWAAIYQKGALKSIEKKEISLAAGESANDISVTLTVPEGQNLSVKSGIWNSMSTIKPFVSVADFLSTDVDLKQITIDGEPLDGFNTSVTAYKEYITPLMVRAPHIGAVAKNNYSKISVSDFSLPGTAQITVSGANGAQKIYSVEFANDPAPTLSEIKVNGTAISDFDSDLYDYEYEYNEGDTIIPTVSALATTAELDVQVTQATALQGGSATITVTSPLGVQKVYTVDFVKESTPGVISNVYMNGASTSSVYGIPSLGAKLINYYDEDKTPEQMLYELQKSDNPYVNNGYLLYSNRTMTDSWRTIVNKYYGYNLQFIYADTGSSMFIGPKVTRLFKPDTDRAEGATSDASKAYEFDISKSATVYITTSKASSYIEGLGTWTHENNSKYKMQSPSYKEIAATDSTTTAKYRIPTGVAKGCEIASGDVYYRHFNANERVSIPAFSDTVKSYRNMGVFVVWDECNSESNIYDIKADGTSIGFNKDTLSYTHYLKSDATQAPTISVEATAGANVQITQATATDGSAIVNVTTADGTIKTYTINFVVREGDTSLSSLGYTFAGQTTPIALTSNDGVQNKYYEVILPNGFMSLGSSELPKLTAVVNDATASASVTDIETFPETATVKVTSGSSVGEYNVRFRYENGEVSNLSQKLSAQVYTVKHDLRPLSFYELRDLIAKEGGVVWEDYCKLYMDRGGEITLSETPSLQRLPSKSVLPQISTTDKENPTYSGDPRYITSYNNYWDKSQGKWTLYWFSMWIARDTKNGSTSPYFNGATHILASNNDNKPDNAIVKTVMEDAISFSIDRAATVYIASAGSSYPSYEAAGSGWTKDNTGLQLAESDQMHKVVYYKHFNANETVKIPTPSVDGGTAQTFGNRMMAPLIVWDGAGTGDTSLASVSVDGNMLTPPESGTQYTASAAGSMTVAATANDSAATVYIKQATSASDTAKIYVMSKNECSIYTVVFTD